MQLKKIAAPGHRSSDGVRGDGLVDLVLLVWFFKLCAIEEDSRGGWVAHLSSDGVRGDGGSGQGQGRGGYDRREQKMCRLTYSFCRCQRQW